jgi:16S rRNA G527 N7-methylase RsmG
MLQVNKAQRALINRYIDLLFEENEKYNLVSRKMTWEEFSGLVDESLLLGSYIGGDKVVDAGSGNGLLGIVLAVMFQDKRVFLVEPKQKKANFLRKVINNLKLVNAEVFGFSVTEFFQKKSLWGRPVLVARGFPDNSMLASFLTKGFVDRVLVITSINKIKKIEKQLEKLKQKIYNIPSRDNLRILKMENVSRETKKK